MVSHKDEPQVGRGSRIHEPELGASAGGWSLPTLESDLHHAREVRWKNLEGNVSPWKLYSYS